MIAGIVASQLAVTLPATVVNPSIINSYCYAPTPYEAHFTVQNNDLGEVIIYAEINDSTPDISRGTVVAGGTTAEIVVTGLTANYIIYAQATATGRTSSAVVSLSVNIGTCEL